ncbi:MAG: ATP-binding cassette domain-containing protein [Butyrivibrio sp.]|nr:ATP-binding cassette domain-containing protein [Butyrivibrio sp.]
MDYILTSDNISKQYKHVTAVDSVSLHVPKGSIYGFIGRNGAGKTTTLKILSGLASPTSGSFTVFGCTGGDLRRRNMFSRIGILIENPGLYTDMSAYDNIKMKCLYAGIKDKSYIDELLSLVGLSNTGRRPARNFSLGMKQRLGIALALVGSPEILFLDEPINGLDPQGIAEIRETIVRLNKERGLTIIISSHILEELSKVATDYGIINNGRLAAELTAEELSQKCESRIVFKLYDIQSACDMLTRMGITRFKVMDPGTIHVYERLDQIAQIGMALSKADILISGLWIESAGIEEFFFNMTGGVHNA